MCTAQVIVEINQKWHNKCKYLIPTFFFFFPQWLQPNMNEKLLNFFASECSNNRDAWKSVGAKSDAHEGTPQYNNFPPLLRFILHCVMLENNTFSVRHYWYNASFAWWLAINVSTSGPSLFHQFVIDNILFFYIPPEIKTCGWSPSFGVDTGFLFCNNHFILFALFSGDMQNPFFHQL